MPKTSKTKAAKSAPKKTTVAPAAKTKAKVTAKKTAKVTKPATKPAKKKPAATKPSPSPKKVTAKKTLSPQMELVRRCVRALDDKKAESLRVLHVGEKSSVTDYFIIATGNSDPHLRALRVAIQKELAGTKEKVLGVESQPESGWCVVDVFDVMVHIFLKGQRENFKLESLWKDGVELPVTPLLD